MNKMEEKEALRYQFFYSIIMLADNFCSFLTLYDCVKINEVARRSSVKSIDEIPELGEIAGLVNDRVYHSICNISLASKSREIRIQYSFDK